MAKTKTKTPSTPETKATTAVKKRYSLKALGVNPQPQDVLHVSKECKKDNPKREGTKAHAQFAVLQKCDGKTVQQYHEAFKAAFPKRSDTNNGGAANGELGWSLGHGFVTLESRKATV